MKNPEYVTDPYERKK